MVRETNSNSQSSKFLMQKLRSKREYLKSVAGSGADQLWAGEGTITTERLSVGSNYSAVDV
jgi:hypothetical protein